MNNNQNNVASINMISLVEKGKMKYYSKYTSFRQNIAHWERPETRLTRYKGWHSLVDTIILRKKRESVKIIYESEKGPFMRVVQIIIRSWSQHCLNSINIHILLLKIFLIDISTSSNMCINFKKYHTLVARFPCQNKVL